MAKKKAIAEQAVRQCFPVEIAAGVAYEAVRELRRSQGDRSAQGWEFVDGITRARAIERAKAFEGADPEVDPNDTETLIYQRIVNLMC